MNETTKVALKALRLSSNPNAIVGTHNGEEVNMDINGKPYCIASFQEFGNPFSTPCDRMIRLDKLSMKDLSTMIGKVVPGASIITVDTEPYTLNNGNIGHKYTTCVIAGLRETLDSILLAQGIVRKGTANANSASQAKEAAAKAAAEENLPQ